MAFKLGIDSNGNYGYIKDGADTVTPFRTGTATTAQVLSGYTFANATYPDLTGAMPNNGGTTKSATYSLDTTNSRVVATIPTNGYYNTSSKLYATYASVRTLIGLTATKIVKGNTILGLAGTAIKAYTTLSALFQHYYTQNQNKTYTATKDCTVLAICLQTTHGGDGSGGYKSTLTTTGEILSSNKYRKNGYMDHTYRAVDMDTALIKLTNGNNIKMVTPACGNACTIMQVFELS